MSKHKNTHVWPPKKEALQHNGAQMVGVQQTQRLTYSGPIPMASELEKYEKILPGSANRIIGMAEKQEIHRHGLESAVVTSNVRNERLGMHYTFVLTGALMLLGAAMIFTGKETGGYFALFGPVVFQGGNYLYHKKIEKNITHPPKDKVLK